MPYIGKEPVAGNFVLLDSITTSATATYALTKDSVAYSPESARNMIVSLNGVTQAPETAFTVSGSNITFSSALTASDVIDYILVLGDVLSVGTPSDGTVGTSQMSYPLGNFSSTGIDDNATSTAITIDSNENVGIGTASPKNNLDVIGSTGIYQRHSSGGRLVFDDVDTADASNPMSFISNVSGTLSFGNADRNPSNGLTTNSSTSMTINSSGKVGIGTTSPSKTLHVNSGVTTDVAQFSSNAASFVFGASTGLISMDLGATDAYRIRQSGSERMRIDSSGRVGIGTTSPSNPLNVIATNTNVLIEGTGVSSTGIAFETNNITRASIGIASGSTALSFFSDAGSTERMRIDSSGNLLVGKTSTAFGTAGVEASAGNGLWSTRSSLPPLALNRLTTHGDIVNFYKDGTTVGGIGTKISDAATGGGELYFASGNTGLFFDDVNNYIRPCTATAGARDNIVDLGKSDNRFKDLYLSGGAYLGGTGAANHLDDYEEGTWTPEITGFGQSTFTQTYSQQTGKYVKVGDLVVASFYVTLSSKGNISGAYTHIKGLPFNHGGSVAGSAIIWGWGNLATASVMVSAELSSTSNVAWLTHATGAVTSTSYMNTSVIGNTTSLRGTLIYRIS